MLSSDSRDAHDLARGLTRELVEARLCDHSGMWLQQNGQWQGAAFPDNGPTGVETLVVVVPDGEWVDSQSYVMEFGGRSRLWMKWHQPLEESQREALSLTRPLLRMCLRELCGRTQVGDSRFFVAQLGAALANSFQLDQLLHEILQACIGLTRAAGGRLEISSPVSHQRQVHHGNTELEHRLTLPFSRHDQIQAAVQLFFHDHVPIPAEQMELLQAFSSQACLAIENVLVHEKEQEFAREALALYRAAREIEEGLDLDDVLERSVSAISKVASVDRCMILLKDQVRPVFSVASALGVSADREDFFVAFRLALGSLPEDVRVDLESGKAVCYACPPSSEAPRSSLDGLFALQPGDQCLLLPLLVKERLIGLIFLDASRPGFSFTENIQRLVQTLTLQVANAIQRASLLHQLQENLGPLKALYQVSTAITGTLSLNKVVKLIVEQTAELLDHSACALLVLDEIGEGFRLETSLGLNEELLEPALQARIARTAVERKRATALYVDKDPECQEFADILRRADFGGLLSVPLIARKKMVGVLNCFVPLQIRFRQQEIRFLKGFANQAAIAVENARLHGLVRFKMGELGTLFEVSKAVTSTLQLDRVLEEIVRHVRDILRADACSLMLVEGPCLVLRTVEGLPPGYRCKPIAVGQGVAGIAAKMATPMILLDQDRISADFPESLRGFGLRSILCVPIENRGRVLGVVNVYYKELLTAAPAQITGKPGCGGHREREALRREGEGDGALARCSDSQGSPRVCGDSDRAPLHSLDGPLWRLL